MPKKDDDASAAPSGEGVTGVPVPPGTAAEAAAQGMTGAKVQADQQATVGAKGEDVPVGGNPYTAGGFKDPKRKAVVLTRTADGREVRQESETKAFVVADKRFSYGGESFTTGETIYLSKEESERLKSHLVPQNIVWGE